MNIKQAIGYELSDALDMLMDVDSPLKVGARDGTNYFYCGTASDLKKNLDKVSRECYQNFKILAENSALSLEADVRRFPHLPNRISSETMLLGEWVCEVKSLAESLESSVRWLDFLADCGRWQEKVRDRRRTAKNARDRFRQFIPLNKRGVVDAFYADPAADADRPSVLIISGYEVGEWWTMEDSR